MARQNWRQAWVSSIWEREKDWPFDASGRIFFARAILAVGRARYGAQWQDTDPILQDGTPVARMKLPPDLQNAQHAKAARTRYEGVSLAIREHCAKGELASFVQSDRGDFTELGASIWNTRRFERWFRDGKLSSVDAFGGFNTDDTPKYWLFFDGTMLDELLSRQKDDAATAVGSDERIPQPEYEEVENFFIFEVKELWKGHDKSPHYRVTRDEFETLCKRKWPGCNSTIPRSVWGKNRPEDWEKRGPNKKNFTVDDIARELEL